MFKRSLMRKFLVVLVIVSISIVWQKTSFINNIVTVFNQSRELPVYCVDTDEKKIAISFDAAWGDQYTEKILDILDEYNVKTTFFLVEFWADKYPEMVKKIHVRGHEIGNHSSNHPHMSKLSEEQIIKEIKGTEKKVESIIGEKTVLFRPPFGDYNDRLIKTCRDMGYHVIQWDVDSLDWKEMGVKPVVDRVTRNVKKGSIVLFHNNAKYVPEYLPIVLEKLTNEGYSIVPVSQLIYKQDYYIDSSGQQKKAQ